MGAGPPRRKPLQIPGFEIEAEVGRGGMGIVYRARQTSIGRQVAVKVLPTAATKNPAFVERFLREAKAAARLNHENVVSAIDAGRAGDVVYFVMEFIDGETIRERIDREGPLPVDLALAAIRDTAKALVHAHRHGLVHRDVKPDNIMLGADGRALLCDLGLARMVEESKGAEGKRTGIAEGTPYYIAPEQAKGFADIDIRADIYALGATAYHMLAGEYPYDGADAREIMLKQVNAPFPDILEKRPDLPPAVAELIGRMVEKSRDARMATPAEVVAAIERIMAGSGDEEAVDAGAPAQAPSPALVVGLAGAALALLIAIVGGVAVLRHRPKPAPKVGPPAGLTASAHAAELPVPAPELARAAPEDPTRSAELAAASDISREADAARKLEVLRAA
ncbi:MAG TPA: protein kinase, partial [Planctomycetota bacterium]|nr:protein kinase [Planctomycetota bacterium]